MSIVILNENQCLSEIYKSLCISRIEYFSEGVRRNGKTMEIDTERILEISSESTSGLNFIGWSPPTEFDIAVHSNHFTMKINEDLSVTVNRE